jgi:hypothetical protein
MTQTSRHGSVPTTHKDNMDSHTAQEISAMSQAWTRPHIPWVFAGRIVTVREMADLIWSEDSADKTAFLLRWGNWNEHN